MCRFGSVLETSWGFSLPLSWLYRCQFVFHLPLSLFLSYTPHSTQLGCGTLDSPRIHGWIDRKNSRQMVSFDSCVLCLRTCVQYGPPAKAKRLPSIPTRKLVQNLVFVNGVSRVVLMSMSRCWRPCWRSARRLRRKKWWRYGSGDTDPPAPSPIFDCSTPPREQVYHHHVAPWLVYCHLSSSYLGEGSLVSSNKLMLVPRFPALNPRLWGTSCPRPGTAHVGLCGHGTPTAQNVSIMMQFDARTTFFPQPSFVLPFRPTSTHGAHFCELIHDVSFSRVCDFLMSSPRVCNERRLFLFFLRIAVGPAIPRFSQHGSCLPTSFAFVLPSRPLSSPLLLSKSLA